MARRLGPASLIALCTVAVLASGCPLGYYMRSAAGGARLLLDRRPIPAVIADRDTPPELAERLRTVQRIRAFASRVLALPEDKSYTTYVRLHREAAVWTVVAAPELSVEPVEWCFVIVGCVSYRGYFSEKAARRFADRLARRGDDVVVDGRIAYSTLGHFADPVLSTFLDLPEPELAGLIFHELAHRRVYAPDDTAFDESFATAVEQTGVERWLDAQDDAAGRERSAYRKRQQREQTANALLLGARRQLAAIYAAERPVSWKRERKAQVLGELRATLDARIGRGAEDPLNNARLASVGDYQRWKGAFDRLLADLGGDLPAFYREVERLARLPADKRQASLEELGERGDSGGTSGGSSARLRDEVDSRMQEGAHEGTG